MDWTINDYENANHPPVVKLASAREIEAKVGDRVELSVEGSSDPDGNKLSYEWFYYPEVGTFNIATARKGNPLKIEDADKAKAWFIVPKTERNHAYHCGRNRQRKTGLDTL